MATQIIASQGEHLESRPLITSSRTVHPAQLNDAGREALFHELLVINQQVFEGPWLQAISEGVAKGHHGRTAIQLYFNARQECVGYAALLGDEFEHEGKPWTVFRAITALLPEYRGRQSVMGFYLSEITRYALRNPRRRVFFFTPVVHISSYRVLARHAREMYPLPGRPVPADVMELMQRLGARYNLAPIEGEHPLIRRRPMWVRGSQGRQSETGDAFDRSGHVGTGRVRCGALRLDAGLGAGPRAVEPVLPGPPAGMIIPGNSPSPTKPGRSVRQGLGWQPSSCLLSLGNQAAPQPMNAHYPRVRLTASHGAPIIREGITICFYMRRSHREIARGPAVAGCLLTRGGTADPGLVLG